MNVNSAIKEILLTDVRQFEIDPSRKSEGKNKNLITTGYAQESKCSRNSFSG